jgi:hypothetical protein
MGNLMGNRPDERDALEGDWDNDQGKLGLCSIKKNEWDGISLSLKALTEEGASLRKMSDGHYQTYDPIKLSVMGKFDISLELIKSKTATPPNRKKQSDVIESIEIKFRQHSTEDWEESQPLYKVSATKVSATAEEESRSSGRRVAPAPEKKPAEVVTPASQGPSRSDSQISERPSDPRWCPLLNSYRQQGRSKCKVIVKWFVPGFLNGCCILTSMWLLHIATYQYVHRMSAMNHTLTSIAQHKNMANSTNSFIQHYGVLLDPIAALLPHKQIDIGFLDKLTMIFPGLFFLGMFIYDDLRLYTKIMFCNGMLALLKGSMDAMTVLPDSSGWENCQARLNANGAMGVAFFQKNHTMVELLRDEVLGVNGHRFRYCSDMLVSGHTYFVTIYALGCYELIRIVTSHIPSTDSRCWIRVLSLTLISLSAVVEQVLEVYYVTSDRFHYSMDIALAILAAFVIYTNIIPAAISKWWLLFGVRERGEANAQMSITQADVLIPVCCFPFCCFMGRYHSFDESTIQRLQGQLASEGFHFDSKRNLVGEGVHAPLLTQ